VSPSLLLLDPRYNRIILLFPSAPSRNSSCSFNARDTLNGPLLSFKSLASFCRSGTLPNPSLVSFLDSLIRTQRGSNLLRLGELHWLKPNLLSLSNDPRSSSSFPSYRYRLQSDPFFKPLLGLLSKPRIVLRLLRQRSSVST